MTEQLPMEVAAQIRTMRDVGDERLSMYLAWGRAQNWTGEQLAAAMGVTRQAVNLRVNRWIKAHGLPRSQPKDLPRIPYRKPSPKVGVQKRDYTLNVPATARLIGLWVMSSRVRGTTPEDHPNRIASRLFDDQVQYLVRGGHATLREIAHDIDVEERILRLRLTRHGYTAGRVMRTCAVCGEPIKVGPYIHHQRLNVDVHATCPQTDVCGEDITTHAVFWCRVDGASDAG